MLKKILIKVLLYPVFIVYKLAVQFRNLLYDKGYLHAVRFDFPVISIGNLSMGGTGKTPHTEYLLQLLLPHFKVATLSRGYRRNSSGFKIANISSTSADVGDEPRQFKWKFPEAIVAVGEERVLAIPQILHLHPDTDVIVCDDAYQHRALKPGLSMLLTTYDHLFCNDEVFPLGWLREPATNYNRADILVVTKCPLSLSEQQKNEIISKLHPYSYQKTYFTRTVYGQAYPLFGIENQQHQAHETEVLLVTGIHNHHNLKFYLESNYKRIIAKTFPNHHRFDLLDLDNIIQTFQNMGNVPKVIIATEKDAARLLDFRHWFLENKTEIFVVPVQIEFLFNSRQEFETDIFNYIRWEKDRANKQTITHLP